LRLATSVGEKSLVPFGMLGFCAMYGIKVYTFIGLFGFKQNRKKAINIKQFNIKCKYLKLILNCRNLP